MIVRNGFMRAQLIRLGSSTRPISSGLQRNHGPAPFASPGTPQEQGFLPRIASMQRNDFQEEAQRCREQALAYVGQPEAELLLQVACAFDDLASRPTTSDAPDQKACAKSQH